MKSFQSVLCLLTATGLALAISPALRAQTPNRRSAPTVITPPAVHDGSNFSRAPFPASRPFDDIKRPNGQAVDLDLPPNTPSTNPDPVAPPPPAYAVLQPRVAPGLMPTGRASIGAAAALDAAHEVPTIRNDAMTSRDQLLDDVELRVRGAEATVNEYRHTTGEMSASGQEQFKGLIGEVHARQKALLKSVRRARDARDANWESAREQLAADYDAYASALAQLDAAAGVQPVR